jgi:hypothetical protein
MKMQTELDLLDQVEIAHLENLKLLCEEKNELELEKLYYTILTDAALSYEQNPTLEGSYLTIDPMVCIAYFRRNKCPTVWKSSSRAEYDLLYEITCRLTEKIVRDFLQDVWIGIREPGSLPSFL